MKDDEIANVNVESGAVTTRQVRRAENREIAKRCAHDAKMRLRKTGNASAALARMRENSERVGDEQAAKLQRMRQLLFAIVKREGRVRLTRAELAAIEPRAGLDVKVQENGDLVVTFLRGSERA